uniref:Uncharacterized protein n=1 Tax=Anguilla anguilla TaxID=7936 RepID=A0A0E9S364_ANGAN
MKAKPCLATKSFLILGFVCQTCYRKRFSCRFFTHESCLIVSEITVR